MRIMRLTVTVLVGFLVLGVALPATAQVLMDSATLDSIKWQLDRALDGVNRGNLLKAFNHINRALALLPDSEPAPVGWFKIVTPFTWHESAGPMPVSVGAMIDDGTPQPLFTDTVVLGMMAYGQIVALYDSNMVLLPGTETTRFSGGGWQGYVMLSTSTGLTQDLGLRALDPDTGIGGNSQPIRWTVP